MVKCRMFTNHVPLCCIYVHFVIIVSIINDYYTGIHKFILKFLVGVNTEIPNEGKLIGNILFLFVVFMRNIHLFKYGHMVTIFNKTQVLQTDKQFLFH